MKVPRGSMGFVVGLGVGGVLGAGYGGGYVEQVDCARPVGVEDWVWWGGHGGGSPGEVVGRGAVGHWASRLTSSNGFSCFELSAGSGGDGLLSRCKVPNRETQYRSRCLEVFSRDFASPHATFPAHSRTPAHGFERGQDVHVASAGTTDHQQPSGGMKADLITV